MEEKYLRGLDGKYIHDATGSKIPLEVWSSDPPDGAPTSAEELVRTLKMLGQPVPRQLLDKLWAAQVEVVKRGAMTKLVDVNFDFRTDTPQGKDPDSHSPALRSFHKTLWSKELPNGHFFRLDDSIPNAYLHHSSEIGEFFLASDAITHSYKNVKRMQDVIEALPQDYAESLYTQGCKIGSYTLFPGRKINNKMTINGARGLNARIGDRFDLTLECIRRFYSREGSPLGETLDRYANFFNLFESFQGYVEFFLLQDLVSSDFGEVNFYLPFAEFDTSPYPSTTQEYMTYRDKTLDFVESRSTRMKGLFS